MKKVFSSKNLLATREILLVLAVIACIGYPLGLLLAFCATIYLCIVCMKIVFFVALAALPCVMLYDGHWIMGVYIAVMTAAVFYFFWRAKLFTLREFFLVH